MLFFFFFFFVQLTFMKGGGVQHDAGRPTFLTEMCA